MPCGLPFFLLTLTFPDVCLSLIFFFCRKNDCPWTKYVVKNAEKSGHKNLAEWALSAGCPEYLYRFVLPADPESEKPRVVWENNEAQVC